MKKTHTHVEKKELKAKCMVWQMNLFSRSIRNQKAIKITFLDKRDSECNADWQTIKGVGVLWSVPNPYRSILECQSRDILPPPPLSGFEKFHQSSRSAGNLLKSEPEDTKAKQSKWDLYSNVLNKWVVCGKCHTSIDVWRLIQAMNCERETYKLMGVYFTYSVYS